MASLGFKPEAAIWKVQINPLASVHWSLKANVMIVHFVTQDDLWQALTIVGQESRRLSEVLNVKEIMDTWTLQMGYPVVTAQK